VESQDLVELTGVTEEEGVFEHRRIALWVTQGLRVLLDEGQRQLAVLEIIRTHEVWTRYPV